MDSKGFSDHQYSAIDYEAVCNPESNGLATIKVCNATYAKKCSNIVYCATKHVQNHQTL